MSIFTVDYECEKVTRVFLVNFNESITPSFYKDYQVYKMFKRMLKELENEKKLQLQKLEEIKEDGTNDKFDNNMNINDKYDMNKNDEYEYEYDRES